MHSSMHIWHIAMHASSIDIITVGVMPCMRIIERIMVLHMSAQFMHAGAQSIIWVEHTVHACSQAEQASIQACMTDMSMVFMPGIAMASLDIMFIIIESTSAPFAPLQAASAACTERYSSTSPASPGHPHAQPDFTRRSHRAAPRSLERMPDTTTASRSFARTLAAAAAALLLVTGGLVAAAPASAHDELVSTDPAADSTVEELPAQLTLTFSGELATDAGATELQVTDAAGTSLGDGDPAVGGTSVTQALTGAVSGPITVLWKVVSSDGHPISGQFAFTVTAPATPTPKPTAETPAPTASATPSDTPSAEPTETPTVAPEPVDSSSAALPWIIAGLLLAAVGGAVTYLLVSRARRLRAEEELRAGAAEAATGGSTGGSAPRSEPPADR